MKAQIIALSLILMLSLTSVTAQTNFEIEKNIVEFTTIATELPAHYSKSCSYTWDSTSYVGETVKINAMIADSDGKTAEDSVKVEVVDSDISSGGGGGHSMSGDKLEIQINQPGGRIVSGKVNVVASAKGPAKLERMGLQFIGEEQNSYWIPFPEENCISSEEHPIPDVVEIEISPEKQYTETGSAVYKVIVKDNHPTGACIVDEESSTTSCSIEQLHKYSLAFLGKKVDGKLEQEKISLKSGETKTIRLDVEAEEKGTYFFAVYAYGDDAKAKTNGVLVFGEDEEPQIPTPAFFVGEGFAINEESSEGRLVNLNILKDEENLRGKMTFGEENFRIDGAISNEEVYFSVYERNDADLTVSIGEFHGQVTKYDQFLLLEGDLEFETMVEFPTWHLTAISKRRPVFKESIIVESSVGTIVENVRPEEVVTIKTPIADIGGGENQPPETEVYIMPKKIERKKVFGFIPNPWGEKIVRFQVTEGNEVQEKTIEAFGKKKIGNYEISVGSLENEEAIEVTVRQTAN